MDREIYAAIRDRILFMEYAPGQILNEKALSEEFGTSRSPIRDVLGRLEWEQLVRVIPRTGTMVAEIELRKMMEVYQVRVELEGLVGRLAAEQITEGHLQQIGALAQECRRLPAQRDRRALIGVDMKFRDVLYDAANNQQLKELSYQLWSLTLRVWYSFFDRSDWKVEVEGMLREIEETREVLTRRDPHEAEAIRQGYLLKFLERIRGKF
ncbi:MAG: GntR family transcriptional regulator [Deferrisomatales bacterium]